MDITLHAGARGGGDFEALHAMAKLTNEGGANAIARVVLMLLERVAELEKQVAELKKQS